MAMLTKCGARFLNSLKPKEITVLEAIVSNTEDYGELAKMVGTSTQTLKNYVSRLLNKSGMDSRYALALFCFRNGILPCPCQTPKEIIETSKRRIYKSQPLFQLLHHAEVEAER